MSTPDATGNDQPVPLDNEQIALCLDETERELMRIGQQDCGYFHHDTQLKAVVLLLLRCASLIRSMLVLLPTLNFDGFDSVVRSFEESWWLAYEFRLKTSSEKVNRWLAGESNACFANLGMLEKHAMGRGHPGPKLGRDYGRLSELAHPTRSAAENSVHQAGTRQGIPEARAFLGEARQLAKDRICYALYRVIWLLLDADADFLLLPAQRDNMGAASGFADAYDRVTPGT